MEIGEKKSSELIEQEVKVSVCGVLDLFSKLNSLENVLKIKEKENDMLLGYLQQQEGEIEKLKKENLYLQNKLKYKKEGYIN